MVTIEGTYILKEWQHMSYERLQMLNIKTRDILASYANSWSGAIMGAKQHYVSSNFEWIFLNMFADVGNFKSFTGIIYFIG